MPIQRAQQLEAGSVCGQTIRRRPQAVQLVLAILVRLELAAQIVVALVVGVLKVVFAIAARLPEVERDIRDRLVCL